MNALSRKVSIAAVIAFSVGGATALEAVSAGGAIAATATVTGKTIYSSTNIRSGPSTSTSIVGHATAGTSFSGTASNGWMQITSGAYSGKYVSLSTLQLSSSTAPDNGTITVKTIYASTNIRTAANLNASIATHVGSGTSITGTLSNGWIHITAPSNLAGKYVSDSVVQYVSSSAPSTGTTPPATSPTPPATVYKVNGPFACTTNPAQPTGACGESVQYALNSWMTRTNAKNVTPVGVSGTYDSATTADVKAFQAASGLPTTGSMDSATWKALSDASSQTNNTLSADIYGKAGDTHPAFPNTIKLSDGRLMMVFTSAQHHMDNAPGATSTWKTYSSDGGYTWTKPVQITLPNGYENDPAGLGIATSGPLAGHPILTTWSIDSSRNLHTEVTTSTDLEGDNWGPLSDLNSAVGHQTFSASPIVQVDDTNFTQAVYVYPVNNGPSVAETVGLTYNGSQFVVGTPSVIAAVAAGATPTGTSTVASNAARTVTPPASTTTSAASATPSSPTPSSTSGAAATTSPSTAATNSVTGTNGGFSEVGMVKLNDGRLFALVRNDTTGNGVPGIFESYSSDGGKTWTKPVFAFTGSGAPHVTQTTDGKLVVIFRNITGPNTPSGSKNAMYRVSDDNGASWNAALSAGEQAQFEMAYGTPVANSDGTVTFVYTNETDSSHAHMVTTPNVAVK